MKVHVVVRDKSDLVIHDEVKEYKDRDEKAKSKLNDKIVDAMIDKYFNYWKRVEVNFI
jgi:hypothetical protein